jgi:uncharacterized protein YnzC (UPF0291/DUF896 family)
MEQNKIDRINELARKSKERSLTPEEKTEQQILREEYICQFRACMTNTLDNTYIKRPDGTVEKLKKND